MICKYKKSRVVVHPSQVPHGRKCIVIKWRYNNYDYPDHVGKFFKADRGKDMMTELTRGGNVWVGMFRMYVPPDSKIDHFQGTKVRIIK